MRSAVFLLHNDEPLIATQGYWGTQRVLFQGARYVARRNRQKAPDRTCGFIAQRFTNEGELTIIIAILISILFCRSSTLYNLFIYQRISSFDTWFVNAVLDNDMILELPIGHHSVSYVVGNRFGKLVGCSLRPHCAFKTLHQQGSASMLKKLWFLQRKGLRGVISHLTSAQS